jgi:hypothetical protein
VLFFIRRKEESEGATEPVIGEEAVIRWETEKLAAENQLNETSCRYC